jgi:diacylglycerol kinase (ATP)
LTDEVIKLLQMRMDELYGTLGGQLMGTIRPTQTAGIVSFLFTAESASKAKGLLSSLPSVTVSPEWNERARIAKDAAAAAVLVLAAGSVLAFVTIVLGRWKELVEAAPLRRAALTGALLAVIVGILPRRAPNPSRLLDAVLGAAALFELGVLAWCATSHAGTVTVALCVAIAISAARRKRRMPDRG